MAKLKNNFKYILALFVPFFSVGTIADDDSSSDSSPKTAGENASKAAEGSLSAGAIAAAVAAAAAIAAVSDSGGSAAIPAPTRENNINPKASCDCSNGKDTA